MTRIEHTFAHLKANNQKALIAYIMAGDPNVAVTVDLMHRLVDAGVDIIEIGLPFSDPMADGQVIAAAAERALAAGTSTRQAVKIVGKFRQHNTKTPVLLMGYVNPIEMIGYDNFVALCEQNGVDGLLLVDLPPNEVSDDIAQQLQQKNINQIFLLAPTTQQTRRQLVIKHGSGFIYYVSVKGVTGSKTLDIDDVASHVQKIKADSNLPVCVGFGIRDGQTAQAVAKFADGVIIGSELVKNFADVNNDNDKISQAMDKVIEKIRELRSAIDQC